jgi:hypothetical protein
MAGGCGHAFDDPIHRRRLAISAIPRAAGPIDLTHRDPNTIEGALVSDSYASLYEALQGSAQH